MDNDAWEKSLIDATREFAKSCRLLVDSNPYPNEPILDHLMVHLLARLWDEKFSQTEIRTATSSALVTMQRHAMGEERSGDRG